MREHSKSQTLVIASLPTPIALVLNEYSIESQPFTRLHRMTDAVELITRFLAIVALSDVYQRHGEFPLSLRKQLATTFARPTFGVWRNTLSDALKSLQEKRQSCFVEELHDFWSGCWRDLLGKNEGDPEREMVALRNILAHAGRLSDDAAAILLEAHRERFGNAWPKLRFLENYSLVATVNNGLPPVSLRGLPQSKDWTLPTLDPQSWTNSSQLESHRVYLIKEDRLLNLFPLHAYGVVTLWREEEHTFREIDKPSGLIYLRYNERRRMVEFTSLGQRAYFAQVSEPFNTEFRKIFNLSAWRKQLEAEELSRSEWRREGYDFGHIIEELTDGLVGRAEPARSKLAADSPPSQVDQVKEWVRSHSHTGGALWIGGKPGVGKSAFMAELAKRFKDNSALCVIPFFFRSGDARCHPNHFYRAAVLKLTEVFGLEAPSDPTEAHQITFEKVFQAAREKQSQTPKQTPILFLLDGVNEIAQHQEFLRSLLTLQFQNTIWIHAGQLEPFLTDIYTPENSERLWENGELPVLSGNDIRAMVQRDCPEKRYELFARDEPEEGGDYHNLFIERLVKQSEGLPLYVRLVIDDLNFGRLSFRDEDKLPNNLSEYFEQILARLKVGDIPQMLTDVLTLLCWAREPMSEEIIQNTLRPLYAGSGAWEQVLTDALRYGHVMTRRSENREGAWGWRLYHESFRQHLRKTTTIQIARNRARNLLLAWCGQWQSHQNPYALRCFAEHLLENERYDELYALAWDDRFLKAQTQVLGSEPDATLHVIQAALRGAINEEKAARMAEFILLHARRLLALRQEPLEALRSGSIVKAWSLADLYEPPDRALLYLLFACELFAKGDVEVAEQTLTRLRDQPLPRISHSNKGVYCAYLLAQVAGFRKDSLDEVAKHLLAQENYFDLSSFLLKAGHADLAWQVVNSIEDAMDRAFSLSEMAIQFSDANDASLAGNCIAAVREVLVHVDSYPCRAISLAKVAIATLKLPNDLNLYDDPLQAAIDSANLIYDSRTKDDALRCIAQALAKSGSFGQAFQAANGIQVGWLRAAGLGEIGGALLDCDEKDAAVECFVLAIQTAKDISFTPNRNWALRDIAKAAARAYALDVAEHVMGMITDAYDRLMARVALAKGQRAVGDSDGSRQSFKIAVEETYKLKDLDERFTVLRTIGFDYFQKGEEDAIRSYLGIAVDDAQGSKHPERRAEALLAISRILAESGQVESARDCLQIAGASLILDNHNRKLDGLISEVAMAFAELHDYSSAISSASCCQNTFGRERVISDVIKHQVQKQGFSAALQGTQQFEDEFLYGPGDRVTALLAISQSLIESGETAAARDCLSLAFQSAKTLKETYAHERLLSDIAEGFSRVKEFSAAYRIAQNLTKPSTKVDLLLTLAKSLGEAGRNDAAGELLNLAFQSVGETDGVFNRSLALDTLAKSFHEAGDTRQAQECLALAVDEAFKDTDSLGYSWELSGRVETALRICGFSTSLKAACSYEEIVKRLRALNALAAACRSRHEADNAKVTLKTGLEYLDLLETDHPDRPGIILGLTESLAEVGEFTTSIQLASSIQNWLLRSYARKRISECLLAAGELQQAYEVSMKIERLEERNAALRCVAQALAGIGDSAGALTAADNISDFREKEAALHSIRVGQSVAAEERVSLMPGEATADQLLEFTSQLVQHDKDQFGEVVIPFAYDLGDAYLMCGVLARLYPSQAKQIMVVINPPRTATEPDGNP